MHENIKHGVQVGFYTLDLCFNKDYYYKDLNDSRLRDHFGRIIERSTFFIVFLPSSHPLLEEF
jgi:hypothetical protein